MSLSWSGGLGHRLANYLEKHPEMGRMVCGFLDDKKLPGKGVMGRTCDLAALARAGFVDEVILAGRMIGRKPCEFYAQPNNCGWT